MDDERVDRRAILGAGVGLLTSLSGCGRLFIDPETTTTPDDDGGDPTATATATATPSPTGTAARTPTPTATAVSLPSEGIEVRNRRFTLRRSRLESFAFANYRFEVENTGSRPITDAEFRVDLRYEHEDVSRIVATEYPRFWFVPLQGRDDDDDEDDGDDGLETDESRSVRDELRFERDGRAENSTASDRFELELALRRVRRR